MIGNYRPPRTGIVITVVSYNSGYERSNSPTAGTICIVSDNGTQATGPWTEELVFRSHRDDVDELSHALSEVRANRKGAYVRLLPRIFIGPALERPRWSATEFRASDPGQHARKVKQVTGATGK